MRVWRMEAAAAQERLSGSHRPPSRPALGTCRRTPRTQQQAKCPRAGSSETGQAASTAEHPEPTDRDKAAARGWSRSANAASPACTDGGCREGRGRRPFTAGPASGALEPGRSNAREPGARGRPARACLPQPRPSVRRRGAGRTCAHPFLHSWAPRPGVGTGGHGAPPHPRRRRTSFLWARCHDSLISFLRFSCSSRLTFRGWGHRP